MERKSKKPVASSNTKSLILYLDTSEPEAVLAVYENSKKGLSLLAREEWLAHRELSATLSDKYTDIIRKAGISSDELGGVAVFVGPGSFTGLRIGISFANGLAYALGIPVYETRKKEIFELTKPQKLAVPFYGAEPNITQPKKK